MKKHTMQCDGLNNRWITVMKPLYYVFLGTKNFEWWQYTLWRK